MLNSFNVVQDDFGRFLLFLHPFWGSQFNTFVMSDQDSSKMRVSERNETCFNCRTEAVSHLQNAKTQKHKITKMQKGAKSIFLIDKENAYILQRKRRWQTENQGCTLCANVPKIYPKWRNGTSQMVKWDIIKGGLGHRGYG